MIARDVAGGGRSAQNSYHKIFWAKVAKQTKIEDFNPDLENTRPPQKKTARFFSFFLGGGSGNFIFL